MAILDIGAVRRTMGLALGHVGLGICCLALLFAQLMDLVMCQEDSELSQPSNDSLADPDAPGDAPVQPTRRDYTKHWTGQLYIVPIAVFTPWVMIVSIIACVFLAKRIKKQRKAKSQDLERTHSKGLYIFVPTDEEITLTDIVHKQPSTSGQPIEADGNKDDGETDQSNTGSELPPPYRVPIRGGEEADEHADEPTKNQKTSDSSNNT